MKSDTAPPEGASPDRGDEPALVVAVDLETYCHLSTQARTELSSKLKDLAAMVLREALSLESAQRAPGAEPDIGRWHIERSWWNLMLRYSHERHPRLVKVLPLLSSVCLFLMGFSSAHLKATWGAAVFVIATVFAAVCIGAIYVLATGQ
jgi:hypothetical protein